MKTVFLRKRNAKDENGKTLMQVLNTNDSLKKVINLNQMNHYNKAFIPDRGEYVTCCRFDECLHKDGDEGKNQSGSYRKGKTFKVSETMLLGDIYGVFGHTARNSSREGVYLEAVRMATPEEIEMCKNKF